jgi:hypothetical protein
MTTTYFGEENNHLFFLYSFCSANVLLSQLKVNCLLPQQIESAHYGKGASISCPESVQEGVTGASRAPVMDGLV